MKKIILGFITTTLLLGGFFFIDAAPQNSLWDAYKTGKIRLEQKLLIDDNNLPEEVFFQSPMEVTMDHEGNLYVVDYRSHNIKKFDSGGKFLKLLGREGDGPGEFTGPYKISFSEDKLVVYELSKRRLSTMDTDGNFINSAMMEISEGSLRGMRAFPNGNILIRKEKTYLWYEDRPQNCLLFLFSPELESVNKIYEQEILRNKYITEPVRTNVPQPFFVDVCWAITPENQIVIGFAETYDISLYDPEKGKISSFSHKFKPVKVTKKDKDDWYGGMTYSRGGEIIEGAQEFVKKNSSFPNNKPPFHDIKVDPEGNILVFTPSTDKLFDFTYFDAFDPKGNFINRVEVVGDNQFQKDMPLLGNLFAAISTNEDDLYQVSLYTISK